MIIPNIIVLTNPSDLTDIQPSTWYFIIAENMFDLIVTDVDRVPKLVKLQEREVAQMLLLLNLPSGSVNLQQAYNADTSSPQILDSAGHGIGFTSLANVTVIVTDGSFNSQAEILPTQINLTSSSAGPGTACNLNLNGNSGAISFGASAGKYIFSDIPEFADNAAAIAGDMNPNEIYRTGDDLKIVH